MAKHLIFATRRFLLYPEDVKLTVLSDDEHSLASEGHLLNFSIPWQSCNFDQRVSHAIRHLLNLYRAHLGLRTDVQTSLLVDIGLMIPAKRHIYDIGSLVPLEILHILGCEVRELLGRVDLIALAPDVRVRVYFLGVAPRPIRSVAFA